MQVADAGLGDPDVRPSAVDVGGQLVGDPGVDRVEREREGQGQGDAADGGEETDPVPAQVSAGEKEGRAHPRKTSAGSRLATNRAGIRAAASAMTMLAASTAPIAAGSMSTRNCGRQAIIAAPPP
jgi:hypothetical protein